ncbi:hypothetical protein IFR05_007432 [Cadophora sp. M221]|nr:hypothetical protein IFR05_007432 [Cadophora sp. M221]
MEDTYPIYPHSPQAAPENKVVWKYDIIAPVKMVTFFLAGTLFAVGYHLYYGKLQCRTVVQVVGSQWTADAVHHSQEWKLRFGMGLPFLARVFLIAAYAWHRVRQDFIAISGLDAMFSAINNPWAFLNWHYIIHIKTGAIFAVIAWLIPFSMLLTSATLTVATSSSPRSTNTLGTLLLFQGTNSSISSNLTNNASLLDPSALVYVYNKPTLMFTYLAVIGLSFICVVLATTRGADLDELMKGNSLGALLLALNIAAAKLQFGLATVPGVRVRRAGFGLKQRGIENLEKGLE